MLQYFDVVVTGCGKPGFFSGRHLLFAVNPDDGSLLNTDNGAPILQIDKADLPSTMPSATDSSVIQTSVRSSVCQLGVQPHAWSGKAPHQGHIPQPPSIALRKHAASLLTLLLQHSCHHGAFGCSPAPPMQKVFQGGSVSDLHELLGVTNASSVLYVGDHIYGDILKSKKSMGWRTMLIVPELQMELQRAAECESRQSELAVLRSVRDDQDERLQWLQSQLRQRCDYPAVLCCSAMLSIKVPADCMSLLHESTHLTT